MPDLPPPVASVCASFLEVVPDGLVTGLYLRGGLGFGEWVPGESDVDFVATLARRPGEADLAALRRAHELVAERHPDVPFDGPHLLAEDLAADPASCPDVPCALHRLFEPEQAVHDGVVAWHELARNGITVTGRPVEELGVWTDADRLLGFTRDNLDTYWRANASGLAELPPEGREEWACCWCVLGVARLHHLLVTGEMTSKSAAGRWGLTHYPARFHPVLREALRIREGAGQGEGGDIRSGDGPEPPHDYPVDDRARDTAEFTAYVVREGTGRG